MAATLFGAATRLDDVSGGEPPFFWVQTAWLLAVAVIVVIAWTVIDRRRTRYVAAHAWFHLFVRLALAAQLLEYGMTKVIPTQFPAPPLTTLVTPVGDLTLSALLWTSIGASHPYEIFTGCIEVLAGLLLLLPRTTTLGAVVALGALTQVFVLNLTYDIGLKVVSFHLIVLALVLLAPDVRALADFFVRHTPAAASPPPVLARTRRGQRLAVALPIVFGAYLLGMYGYINWSFWQVAGGGRPVSVLYGVWNVEEMAVDGTVRSPQDNDYDRRWRRVIFDEPASVVFQRTDDSLARYGATIDTSRNLLALTKGASRTWGATFALERSAADRLTLTGEMDGQHVVARLRRVDVDAYPLLNSTFRWMRAHER